MPDKAELREQLTDAFEGAAYPVTSPMDLIPALPNGPATAFESGEFEMTAMELNNEFSSKAQFPYQNAENLVEDILEALEDEGHV